MGNANGKKVNRHFIYQAVQVRLFFSLSRVHKPFQYSQKSAFTWLGKTGGCFILKYRHFLRQQNILILYTIHCHCRKRILCYDLQRGFYLEILATSFKIDRMRLNRSLYSIKFIYSWRSKSDTIYQPRADLGFHRGSARNES